jgi:hypothetical protein
VAISQVLSALLLFQLPRLHAAAAAVASAALLLGCTTWCNAAFGLKILQLLLLLGGLVSHGKHGWAVSARQQVLQSNQKNRKNQHAVLLNDSKRSPQVVGRLLAYDTKRQS